MKYLVYYLLITVLILHGSMKLEGMSADITKLMPTEIQKLTPTEKVRCLYLIIDMFSALEQWASESSDDQPEGWKFSALRKKCDDPLYEIPDSLILEFQEQQFLNEHNQITSLGVEIIKWSLSDKMITHESMADDAKSSIYSLRRASI